MDAKKRGMNMDRQDEQDFQELKTENFVMEVPKGRKAIARGVSPGGSRRNMSQAPKGRHRHGCIPVAGTESGSCGTGLGKHPLPAGEGRGEGENIASTKKHSAVSTLIRPAATFSLREKECGLHSRRFAVKETGFACSLGVPRRVSPLRGLWSLLATHPS